MELLDEQGARERVLAYLEKREWWIFIPCDNDGFSVVTSIEEAFYSGEASGDFHALTLGQPFMSVFAGKKIHAPAEALSSHISDIGIVEELKAGRDIFFLSDEGARGRAQDCALAFYAFVKGVKVPE